ncbi:UNKNOWN [Stylonychia lemnae]|uniref:Transmembrane protein n=1 Tax=Stylonychia lemnae TaxID=5949 RepID=A0A078AFV7_STYLE|nr:UNKNOWN [Stylonychia lemnae]|eukprot:CDW80721.1 UNKNOWN [Stylonychia lemnae]
MSTLCKRIDCITQYVASTNAIQSGYVQTHPRKSSYDQYLNLFRCNQTFPNKCSLNQLIIPSIGFFRSNHMDNEKPDYCFFNNSLSKQDYQTLDLQVKLTNNTPDYQAYVWYSNDQNSPWSNIVGTFQINQTNDYLQDGFRLANQMMMYVVVFKNTTIISSKSYATLQLSLFDSWNGTESSYDQEAPVVVIIIAVVVGGLITGFCVGAIVWMVMKVIKKRKEEQLVEQKDQDQDVDDDDDGPYQRNKQLKKKLTNTRQQSQINRNGDNFQINVPDLVENDIEKLDNGIDGLVENKDVVKVLPGKVVIIKQKTQQKGVRFGDVQDPKSRLRNPQGRQLKKLYDDNVEEIQIQKNNTRPGTASSKIQRTSTHSSVSLNEQQKNMSTGKSSQKSIDIGGSSNNAQSQNDIGGAFKGSFQYQFKNKRPSNHFQEEILKEDDFVEDKADGQSDFQQVDINQNNFIVGSFSESAFDQNQRVNMVNSDVQIFKKNQQLGYIEENDEEGLQDNSPNQNNIYLNEDIDQSTKKRLIAPSVNKLVADENEETSQNYNSDRKYIQGQNRNSKRQKTIQEVDDEEEEENNKQHVPTGAQEDDKELQNVFYQKRILGLDKNDEEEQVSQDYGYESIQEIEYK